ncbi:MAG: ferredoxin III, nif-specific [Candidatus Accumulibacter sp.]|jgi:Nif-specific ferredoxin III|nr:ferredoxin III, nif-specific [Accumulibacter sp.]
MPNITGLTLGGTSWTPEFVTNINQEHCIGCGRCYKVCPRDVLNLIEKVTDDDDSDDDSDDDGDASIMSLKNARDCIGCGACNRVCPKKCYSYAPSPVLA